MNGRALFRTGIIGAVVAALCCATPILGLALAAGDLRTPVCHPRLRGDPGKPGCGIGVVHRFCSPDKRLRRDAADRAIFGSVLTVPGQVSEEEWQAPSKSRKVVL